MDPGILRLVGNSHVQVLEGSVSPPGPGVKPPRTRPGEGPGLGLYVLRCFLQVAPQGTALN